MLHVKTPEEVLALIHDAFCPVAALEEASLSDAIGRVLARDITAQAYVPDFDRSTVDGFAIRAEDCFGCSDAIPAILQVQAEVAMGEDAAFALSPGACAAVPTGGAIPRGADSVVMLEYTEDYGDGSIGILKPAAPGENLIFRGDDVYPGKLVLKKGRVLAAQDIGALAAVGCVRVPVVRKLVAGVISTGDELVPPEQTPKPGQVRDVNSPMLEAMLTAFGVRVRSYGIVPDEEQALDDAVGRALSECDAVILSGGSSVGVKDAACRIISARGELLLHGIAMKPGKPTILGKAQGKPLVGLPGHPVAAYFVAKLFVLPLLSRLMGREQRVYPVTARLTESLDANHGRAQYQCCFLETRDGTLYAHPIRGKSGLITTLAGTEGYFCIDRDCEGLAKGAAVQVVVCTGG